MFCFILISDMLTSVWEVLGEKRLEKKGTFLLENACFLKLPSLLSLSSPLLHNFYPTDLLSFPPSCLYLDWFWRVSKRSLSVGLNVTTTSSPHNTSTRRGRLHTLAWCWPSPQVRDTESPLLCWTLSLPEEH